MDNDKTVQWDIPGGRIEPHEPLMDALKREISEETGLEITGTPTLIGAQDIFVPTKELHVVRLTYKISGAGTAVISDEHQDSKWMTIDEAREQTIDPYLDALLHK